MKTRTSHDETVPAGVHADGAVEAPVLVCLLGGFRVLKNGRVTGVTGRKATTLLCALALRRGASRDRLLDLLWPDIDPRHASQSLNTLVYFLHRTFGDAIGGAAPVLHEGSTYCLNTAAGVGTDIDLFERAVDAGDLHDRHSRREVAARCYQDAVDRYGGDLDGGVDVQSAVERERLRARHLGALSRLATYRFDEGDISGCLEFAARMLVYDPCREDAHRMMMACYHRRGVRAQALRQYRLCESILNIEFGAIPELITRQLYDRIRLEPDMI